MTLVTFKWGKHYLKFHDRNTKNQYMNQYMITSTFSLPVKQMNDRFDKRDLVQPLTRPVEISLSPDETTRPQWSHV